MMHHAYTDLDGHSRAAKVMTSLRNINLHKSDLIFSRSTILGHHLYNLGQGTGNKVIYASMQLTMFYQ